MECRVVNSRGPFGLGYVGGILADSLLLASGSDDHTVRLWDTATGGLQQTLECYWDSVWSVVFSYNARLLASAAYDRTVRLWDTATGGLQETLNTEGFVNKLEFSQSGLYLITKLSTGDVPSRHVNHAPDSTFRNLAINIEQGPSKTEPNMLDMLPCGFSMTSFYLSIWLINEIIPVDLRPGLSVPLWWHSDDKFSRRAIEDDESVGEEYSGLPLIFFFYS